VFDKALATHINHAKEALETEIECNSFLEEAVQEEQYYPRGRKWAKWVRFRLWKDVPSCECCGWELEDYMDELTADLNPREAVLSRAFMGRGPARGQTLD
jgi:hypothetical protein